MAICHLINNSSKYKNNYDIKEIPEIMFSHLGSNALAESPFGINLLFCFNRI